MILFGRFSGWSGGSVGGLVERFNFVLVGFIVRGLLGVLGLVKSLEVFVSFDFGEVVVIEEFIKFGF